MSEIFTLTVGTSPLILSQPHPGTKLMDGLQDRLTDDARKLPDTDWHIPQLYQEIASDLSATVLSASYSRYVVDLNRDPEGASLYPGQSVTGLCPVDLFDGSPLYLDRKEPDEQEVERRRDQFWRPYHDALQEQINRVHQKFGFALLYDCHSIRSEVPRFFEGTLPDLNLGTADNTSASASLVSHLKETLENGSFSYVLDGRFKGGYITRHYGNPDQNIHAVQMETAQCAYMDESFPFQFDPQKAALLKPQLKTLLEALLNWAQKTYNQA
ncbi:N-formylglutamate deformylase [Sneathiella aquimaris]|uniref:N-formylglutamate deformylase n=1 Tax=Sneathiella aquimaris TaxID=2599305 RepID=UPI00146E5638|nr:N-formylglutamate deformylase [Sneathiella aquimaris]